MTVAEHITRAAAEFEAGRPRYWVKATDNVQRLHRRLYRQARAAGYWDWRFVKDGQSVMIVPYQKGK